MGGGGCRAHKDSRACIVCFLELWQVHVRPVTHHQPWLDLDTKLWTDSDLE